MLKASESDDQILLALINAKKALEYYRMLQNE
jgi:hypothetical protein